MGTAQTTTNQFSSISSIKSVSTLNYVMAGIEKTNKQNDDIIILDTDGHLIEMHIHSLF